ncbi:nucleoside/nucleotide kinase family protein [Amycolatopsis heterodermiae]|uniref:hypothetical protein n=1 Tax=Amycolatopsis heterodermiae TaxID=3110235 RepID=UPI00396AA63D
MTRGLIVTGTRGAGKTTIVDLLLRARTEMMAVSAVTTRSPRADDRPGAYEFLIVSAFAALERQDMLVLSTRYVDNNYGITRAAVQNVFSQGQRPVRTITPDTAGVVLYSSGNGYGDAVIPRRARRNPRCTVVKRQSRSARGRSASTNHRSAVQKSATEGDKELRLDRGRPEAGLDVLDHPQSWERSTKRL